MGQHVLFKGHAQRQRTCQALHCDLPEVLHLPQPPKCPSQFEQGREKIPKIFLEGLYTLRQMLTFAASLQLFLLLVPLIQERRAFAQIMHPTRML
eukprot:1154782-Pelagomonas_calceolata.AAC.1